MEFKTLSRDYVYRGKVINLRRDTLRIKDKDAVWEVVESPNAVTVIPILPDHRVVLIKQYRYVIDTELIELPAGTLEKGESPEMAAVRELQEETGYTAKEVIKLAEFYTIPGLGTELMHLYIAKGLTRGRTSFDEHEKITPIIMDKSQIISAIKCGRIQDGKTLVGLMFYLFGQELK